MNENLNPCYILAETGTRRHVIMMHFGNGDKPNRWSSLDTCWHVKTLNALVRIGLLACSVHHSSTVARRSVQLTTQPAFYQNIWTAMHATNLRSTKYVRGIAVRKVQIITSYKAHTRNIRKSVMRSRKTIEFGEISGVDRRGEYGVYTHPLSGKYIIFVYLISELFRSVRKTCSC